MPDYQNSKIYKIVDNTNGNIYVGSTTEKYLSKRLQRHLSNYKYWIKNNKIYYSSFEIFKNNNYYIELIENVNCNDIYELRNRERYYIENCECVNINVPNRTTEEYVKTEKYKQKKSFRDKRYRVKAGEKLLEKKREFNNEKVDCECGCKISRGNLLRHKKSKKHLDLVLKNV